jgi:O-antigen/teichoic acid export membrane protein
MNIARHLSVDRPLGRIPAILASAQSQLVERNGDAHPGLAAATVFLIRIASAAVAFLSQALLARWMGTYEFGIYAYVWTWVLLLGSLIDFGLATMAQRFLPEYSGTGSFDLLRGFLAGSRWLVVALSTAVAIVAAIAVTSAQPHLNHVLILPLYLACATLPLYGLAMLQDGIARSYNWINLALVPLYIIRPLGIIVLVGVAHFVGLSANAVIALAAGAVATLVAAIVQLVVLNRRLASKVSHGAKAYDFGRWLAASLPILMVGSFYFLLTYTDVLVLEQFRSPHEVAVYYAATKVLALVAFVYFSVSAAAARKFAEYHVAGDRVRLADFLARSIRWTFWPSLAAGIFIVAFGWPILWLFGPDFVDGWPLLSVLVVGLLARAAVGPAERLLNMLGQQTACAMVYAGAFAVNLAACIVLIPRYGMLGAAMSVSAALIVESIALFCVSKFRLGLHVFVWGRQNPAPQPWR